MDIAIGFPNIVPDVSIRSSSATWRCSFDGGFGSAIQDMDLTSNGTTSAGKLHRDLVQSRPGWSSPFILLFGERCRRSRNQHVRSQQFGPPSLDSKVTPESSTKRPPRLPGPHVLRQVGRGMSWVLSVPAPPVDLGQTDWSAMHASIEGDSGLLDGGVDALLVETCQDPLQIHARCMPL